MGTDSIGVRPCSRARPRLRLSTISVRFLAEGEEGIGQLRNISRAGLFVTTKDLPRPGVVVAVQFESPVGHVIDLRGEVRWNTKGLAGGENPVGFGVRLHEPSKAYRDFFDWARSQAEKPEEA